MPDNIINSILISDDGIKWIGTNNGLALFKDDTWSIYDFSNSDIPTSGAKPLLVDEDGNLWTGGSGLASFDGTNWSVYKSSNSDLPHNTVNSMIIDKNNVKWIGTNNGLAALDEDNWTIYNNSNSDLPDNTVNYIAIDDNDVLWIGTDEGLVSINGENWSAYNMSNSEIPDDDIYNIVIDGNNIKWIGTNSGLASFNGSAWTVYNKSNSSLPDNNVTAIAFEDNGTRWIGTSNGGIVTSFNNEVTSVENITHLNENIPNQIVLYQNYPNHFKPYTKIRFSLPEKSTLNISIYNLLGERITQLVDKEIEKGIHEVSFDASLLSSGVYIYQLRTGKFTQSKKLMVLK